MDASELQRLQAQLDLLRSFHLTALRNFTIEEGSGFTRTIDDRQRKWSKISTATAVISICHARGWRAWLEELKDVAEWGAEELAAKLLTEEAWRSRSLSMTSSDEAPDRNPYHVAFATEAALALGPADSQLKRLEDAADYLCGELLRGDVSDAPNPEDDDTAKSPLEARPSIDPPSEKGAISVQFPPSAHLTQLAVRVVMKIDAKLGTDYVTSVSHDVREWALRRLVMQMALLQAGSRSADEYEIAYAAMIVASFGLSDLSPDETRLMASAIDSVFEAQRNDGLWPRSHPLFAHYAIGTAYSYEYEMLSQLLQVVDLQEHMLRHLDELASAVEGLSDYYRLDGTRTWSSGHIPQQRSPESWATASVYQFVYDLQRLTAEATRRELFVAVGVENVVFEPRTPALLDAPLVPGIDDSLTKTINQLIIEPLQKAAPLVEGGGVLPADVPMSAILFGPPGTAKTTIANVIAEGVGWPLVKIDPSHVVGRGLDRVQESANIILGLVTRSEAVVVLLDEFDELMRDRQGGGELVSRFLTTAMLPKLATINAARRIFFIVATNHIANFDSAIIRPGRFDMRIPVLAPSLAEKRKHWPEVEERVAYLDEDRLDSGMGVIMAENLTYDEYKEFVAHLMLKGDKGDKGDFFDILQEHWRHSAFFQWMNDGTSEVEIDNVESAIVSLYKEHARIPVGRVDT